MLSQAVKFVTPLTLVPAPKAPASVQCLICNDTGKVNVPHSAVHGMDCGCGNGKPSYFQNFTFCQECQDTGWMTVFCGEAGTDEIPCEVCGGVW